MTSRDKKTLLLGSRPSTSPEATSTGEPMDDADEPTDDAGEPPSSVSPSVVPSPPAPSERRSTTEIMRTSITEGRKSTTLIELSVVADDLASSGATRRLWMVGGGSTLLALGVACVVLLPLPTWAKALLLLVPLTMLVATAAGAGLKRVTRSLLSSGQRELPGGVHWYVGAIATLVLSLSLGATWGTVEAAAVVSQRLLPPEVEVPEETVVERPRLASRMADRKLKTGGRADRLAPGLLYVPSSFSSDDGTFDLLIHFHGYPPLVQDSVEAAELNAVVLSVNLGLGGGPYKARMAYRDAFDDVVKRIEDHMSEKGLKEAKVGRVAVSAWSAGYGAVFTLLQDPERGQRVDALLLLDTPHGSFVGGSRKVQPESVKPYVEFARRAIDGERLMLITHSAITTDDYASTTETADLILSELRLERSPGGEPVDRPDVDTAKSAFPGGNHKWLEPTSHCRAGQLAVLGYGGREPEDHIAHLAQMSETALPLLVRRWR